MTTTSTLNDLIAWQKPHRKADDESVGQFLRRRLIAHAASFIEEPHVSPDTIAATCKLTGDDPIQLIFDQMECALAWDEPFRSHFFDDAQTWFVGSDLDELMALLDRHGEMVADNKKMVQAALDGCLRLIDDGPFGQLAVVRHSGVSGGMS